MEGTPPAQRRGVPFPSHGASDEELGPSCEQTHSQPLTRAHRALLLPCHLPAHETQNSLDLRVPLKVCLIPPSSWCPVLYLARGGARTGLLQELF